MKQDWQMLVSSEVGGWVQRSSYTLLSCVCLEMSIMKSLTKKKKKEKSQLSSGRVEPNPRQRGEFCCTKSTEPRTEVHAEAQGRRIHQPSEPSCLATCSRLDSPGAPDTCRVCPCHPSGVEAEPSTTCPWNLQPPRCIVSAVGI